MALFDKWCKNSLDEDGEKRFLKFTEKPGGRAATQAQLSETIRSHYDSLKRISDDIKKLGYKTAAKVLRERLPRSKKARSGDLGEILASELVEEKLEFNVPIRRMRYKDGREVALRGDDFIGIRSDKKTGLSLLKGESKSRSALSKDTIEEARAALNGHHGRCTPSSLLFIADRLMDKGGKSTELGRAIRKEVGTKALRKKQIDHALFTLSGNSPPSALMDDFQNADSKRKQIVINVRIEDHQDFIAEIYKEAGKLGNG
jgi:hypothetical protein